MLTFCSRNITDYQIRLDTMEYKICCYTNWKPFDDLLFEAEWVKTRLHDHVSNIRNADCKLCWRLEDQGVASLRNYKNLPHTSITLILSNLCNLSCRYCGPQSSSVWAEMLKDKRWSKGYVNTLDDEYKRKQAIVSQWINNMLETQPTVILNGGESTINPDLYYWLDVLNKPGTNIVINSNLNTTDIWMNKLIDTINRLRDNNVHVFIRASLDGYKEQNDWQRFGSNWLQIERNLDQYMATNVDVGIFPTITPLTLESLLPLCRWLNEMNQKYNNRLKIYSGMIVQNAYTNPTSWIGLFNDELAEIMNLINTNLICDDSFIQQMSNFLACSNNKPSTKQILELYAWLEIQSKSHGGNDWKVIYPKIANYCTQI
jgi:sulfatase maturation enzyme AslB (radical SAM superfamily)